MRLKQWELARWEPSGTDGGTPESYKISQMRLASSPFFGRRRQFTPGRKDSVFHLTANRSTDRRGNRFTKAFHIRRVLGFDHHARQWFGAGVTQHDAPIFTECRLGFTQRARDFRHSF